MIPMKMYRRLFHNGALKRAYSQERNPFSRTWNIISTEVPVFLGLNKKPILYPEHADVVIIGGGFIGSAIAYFLKTRAGEGLSVVVLEKDPTYKQAQKSISLGTITQHYSLPENILLAQFAADFLRNSKEHLGINSNVDYYPHSHLILASEKYAEKMERNIAIQKELGVRSELLTVNDIKQKFPWIKTHDLHLGCIGTECEGTFNAWSLLKGFIDKSMDMGANYVNAEVTGFELEQQKDVLMEGIEPGTFKKINRVLYRTSDNQEHAIKFAVCILAAGHDSSDISRLAKVGNGEGLLRVPLPVEKRNQTVYSINQGTTSLSTPIVSDTSGLWLRKEGLQDNIVCGHEPFFSEDVKDTAGSEFYEKIIKPSLFNRISNFRDDMVNPVGTEFCDYNTYDSCGFLGPHPYHNNLYLATGFGKQGCVHAPGIGRAVAELIIDSNYTTIDLTRLTFDRLLTDNPMVEFNIY